jgi:hypothetical protein
MMRFILGITLIAFVLVLPTTGASAEKTTNKYVGVKICAPCHKAEATGNQFGVWQKSKHADSYKVLTTPKADEIAKSKGLKTAAAESPECLQCHVINADADQAEKTFDKKDGNQCEGCHGPGSAYKSLSVMKDKAKAVAAGLVTYKDDAAIEAKCVTCHNDKSPTYKAFNFKEMWPKIKHSVPKKG